MKEIVKHIGQNKYSCYIDGNGEPLILLHGFTGSKDSWIPLIKKWSSAFQVIAIDLPGHGDTITPNFPTMMDFCDELAKLLRALQIQKCHLLGYSMGGRVALSFAQRHSNLVESLILESASPGLKNEVERDLRKENDLILAEKIMKDGIPSFVSDWENIPLFHTQKHLPPEIQHKIREERLAQTASGLSQSLKRMGTGVQPSWWNRLGSLTMPVQLIVGSVDEKFIQINVEMELAINQSELIIVHDAGHAVHVEQPEKFATIVMEFLYLADKKE